MRALDILYNLECIRYLPMFPNFLAIVMYSIQVDTARVHHSG